MFQIKAPDELSDTLFIRRNPVFFSMPWLQLIPETKFGNIENTEYKKAFLFPSRRNAFSVRCFFRRNDILCGS